MVVPRDIDDENALVGRDRPLLLLDRWAADAANGRPRLVIVSGEAGIGKTRLVRVWAAGAAAAGTRLLMGAAREDVMTPLLPLATALDRLPGVGDLFTWTPRDEDGDRAELSLYLAVTRAVMAAASRRPTALVLDDVHWADQATIDLLGHLVATADHQTPAARLLVLLTMRPGVASDKVRAAVRRLESEPIHRGISLEGLDELGVLELVARRCGRPPGAQLLRSLHEATGGNPLLVDMAVDELAAKSVLEVRGGRLHTDVPMSSVVLAPDGMEAWRGRLDKISPAARTVLELAALLGDGGSVAELQAVAELADDDFWSILTELDEVGLMNDDGVSSYWFRHPLLRHAVATAISSRRRFRMEGEIARRLVVHYGPDAERHAVAIADHSRRAGWPPGTEAVEPLVRAAAEQAVAMGAWAIAADCYEHVLARLPADFPADERARLELSAGQAYRRDFDYPAGYPHLQSAAALAEQAADTETWGEALFWLTGAEVLERVSDVHMDEEMVERFLAAPDGRSKDVKALVLANMAQYHFSRYDVAAGAPAIGRARELAREARRAGTRHLVATVDGLNRMGALDVAGADQCFRDALAIGAAHEDQWQAVWTEVCLPIVDVLTGRLDQAEAAAAVAAERSVATHQWTLHGLAAACRAAAAVGQGRVHDAEVHATAALQSFRRSDYFWAAAVGFPHLAAARAYLGDCAGARRAVNEWRDVGGAVVCTAVGVELLCGDLNEVQALVERHRIKPSRTVSLFSLHQAATAVEVGARLDRLDLIEAGYGHLQTVPSGVVFGIEWCRSLPRVAALAAVRLGLLDEARDWLDRARNAATAASSALEAARTRLVSAELLQAMGADDHAVRAEVEPAYRYAQSNGLLPFVLEAERIVPAVGRGGRHDLVVVYTDLVSSTELNVRVGDDTFLELLREHNRIVRQRLGVFGGLEFTHTGDGVGARFTDANQALDFALGLQADFDEANAEHPDFPLLVRVGLAKGEALEDEGNLFGQTVVRAVRICAAGEAGQVLAGGDVVAAADPSVGRFASIGAHVLKGFGGTTELFAVRRPRADDFVSA